MRIQNARKDIMERSDKMIAWKADLKRRQDLIDDKEKEILATKNHFDELLLSTTILQKENFHQNLLNHQHQN